MRAFIFGYKRKLLISLITPLFASACFDQYTDVYLLIHLLSSSLIDELLIAYAYCDSRCRSMNKLICVCVLALLKIPTGPISLCFLSISDALCAVVRSFKVPAPLLLRLRSC